jgi:hypothetical protein
LDKIKDSHTCSINDIGLYECEECASPSDETYPTIKLRMGSIKKQHWFELRPEDYMTYHSSGNCILQFRSVPNKEGVRQRWLLGSVFLRSYDSIHDFENKRLGLVGKGRSLGQETLQNMYPNLYE